MKSVGALRVRAHSHSEVMCTICVRQLKQEKYARQQQCERGGAAFRVGGATMYDFYSSLTATTNAAAWGMKA